MASNVAPHTSHAVTCNGAASCGMISRGITDSVPAPYVRSTREKQYVAKQSLQQTLARHSRERSVPHRSQRRTFCGYSGVLLCVQRSSRGSVKLTSVPDAQCTHEKKMSSQNTPEQDSISVHKGKQHSVQCVPCCLLPRSPQKLCDATCMRTTD